MVQLSQEVATRWQKWRAGHNGGQVMNHVSWKDGNVRFQDRGVRVSRSLVVDPSRVSVTPRGELRRTALLRQEVLDRSSEYLLGLAWNLPDHR